MIAKDVLRALAAGLGRFGPTRAVLKLVLALRRGADQPHPFDLAHGVRTSGFLPTYLLASGATCYLGCVPSAVRTAIESLGPIETFEFIDIGCGKGRALCVASEYPFKSIRGVELSGDLVKLARANAAEISSRYPARTRIEVEEGDASLVARREPCSVVFLYNPFNEALLARLLDHLIASSGERGGTLFIVYENPVYGDRLDGHPALRRWFSVTIPYAPSELGHGPDTTEPVVIWRAGGEEPSPHPSAHQIEVVTPGWRVALREPNG